MFHFSARALAVQSRTHGAQDAPAGRAVSAPQEDTEDGARDQPLGAVLLTQKQIHYLASAAPSAN